MGYIDHLLILVCIYIILSVSLNLITGYVGLLNLGHAAFFGIGAYASALLVKVVGVPWPAALVLGAILAGIAGLLIGIPCLRLRGDYLAIATLGFGEIIRAVMKNWTSLTRGPRGIPGIPKPELFGYAFTDNGAYLLLSFIIMLIVVFIVWRMVASPFGRVLRAIREDEIGALTLGKNIVKYKLIALSTGAFFAGIAGSLYAHYITFIDPSSFTLLETVLIVSMAVLGGLGSITGSVIGAIILILLPEPLRFLDLPSYVKAAMRQIIYSIILILLIIFRPEGLLGEGAMRTSTIRTSKVRAWLLRVQEKVMRYV